MEELTQRVKQPVFHRSGKAWREFRFSRLEKVSRFSLGFLNQLEALMPGLYSGTDGVKKVQTRLSEVIGEPVRIKPEFSRVVATRDLRKYVREPSFFCVVASAPEQARSVMDVDLDLAHAIIDVLLGGDGNSVALKPLGDIENGMMSYVVLELLKSIAPSLSQSFSRLTLEGVADDFGVASRCFAEDSHVIVAQVKVGVGKHIGSLRFLLSASALAKIELPVHNAEANAQLALLFRQRQNLLSGVNAALRLEIGHARLHWKELRGLNLGDVILLDGSTARPDTEDGGTVKMCFGHGEKGFLEAQLDLHEGLYQARVTRVCRGPMVGQSAGAAADGDLGNSEEFNVNSNESSEMVELMDDIPLHLSVEMARLPMLAHEVVQMKVGQVLELNRGVGEAVDLAVNGKVVGRGELVEVDGQLGVRITQLADN